MKGKKKASKKRENEKGGRKREKGSNRKEKRWEMNERREKGGNGVKGGYDGLEKMKGEEKRKYKGRKKGQKLRTEG